MLSGLVNIFLINEYAYFNYHKSTAVVVCLKSIKEYSTFTIKFNSHTHLDVVKDSMETKGESITHQAVTRNKRSQVLKESWNVGVTLAVAESVLGKTRTISSEWSLDSSLYI